MDSDLQVWRIYLSLNAIMENSVIEGLEHCVVRRTFRAGEVLLLCGDTLEHLYYLAKGRVRPYEAADNFCMATEAENKKLGR